MCQLECLVITYNRIINIIGFKSIVLIFSICLICSLSVSSFPIFFCLEYFYILFYPLYWLINYISVLNLALLIYLNLSSNNINILSIININISNICWHKKFLFLHDLLQSAVYLIAGRIAYQQNSPLISFYLNPSKDP